MKISLSSVAIFGVLGLSACVGEQDYTSSSFATPNGTSASATISKSLSNEQNGQVYDASLGGAAYLTGTNSSGAHAYAGVMPGSSVGSAVSSGTATYSADYEVAYISSISVSGNLLSGFNNTDAGTIALTLDTSAGTLTGSNGNLTVDGDVSGTAVSGDAVYRGVSGDLTGLVGDEGTVGAFQGDSDSLVYAGGFVGAID